MSKHDILGEFLTLYVEEEQKALLVAVPNSLVRNNIRAGLSHARTMALGRLNEALEARVAESVKAVGS